MISSFKKQLKGAAILGALLMGGNAFAQLGLTWSEMGPNDIAGRCRSIIVDKTDPSGNKLFAAGVSGGVFKSTNAGATWSPVNDQAPSLIVSCMDQDINGNIYFGTGETFSHGGDAAGSSGFIGTGLYKIAANTSNVTLLKDSSVFGNINEVAVDQLNVIYVAAEKGFFISTDGGVTFNEETISAVAGSSAMDVKIARNGDIYYSAGVKTATDISNGATTSSTSAVYFSAAGSGVYTAITPTVITNRGRIEIAPSPADANYVYLSIAKQKTKSSSTSGGLSAILISDNKGTTWTTITIGTSQFDPFTSITTGVGLGDYSNTIAGDPINAQVCYLGSDVFYIWAQNNNAPLGQGSWFQIGTNFPIPFALYIHANVHDIKFDRAHNTQYIATDGGIYKTVSGNSGFLPYNSGFNVSQFYSVAVPNYPRYTQSISGPDTIFLPKAGVAGGSIGNSLTYLPGNNSNNPMESINFGFNDAFQSDFSKISPKSVFYSTANGAMLRTNDVNSSTPPSTFYDVSYKLSGNGSPGASTFANDNTPMRLWENYTGMDSMLFYNEIAKVIGANSSSTKTSFTVASSRPQLSSRYDSILIKAKSTRTIGMTFSTTTTFTNSNATSATFTVNNIRTNSTSKYDSITVKMTSYKLSDQSTFTVSTFTNMNAAASSFSVSNTRPYMTMKYENVYIQMTSFKQTPTVSPKSFTITPTYNASGTSITSYAISSGTASNVTGTPNVIYLDNSTFNDSIRFSFLNPVNDSCIITVKAKYKHYENLYLYPAYNGTTITNVTATGDANTSSASNNTITLGTTATPTDVIKFTFTDPPNDSSIITVRSKNQFYQLIKIIPVYTGTNITSYTVMGDANTTSTTNNMVFLNSNQVDSIRYKFAVSPDSSSLTTTIKFKYLPGDVISVVNTDISGGTFTTTATLTKTLTSSPNPFAATVKLPLAQSARLAVGTNGKSATEGPSVWMTKRPLNFSINPDWVKIVGKNSRMDSVNGKPYLNPNSGIAAVTGTTITHLEWSPSGKYIYFSTKQSNNAYYIYRVSHLEMVSDSANDDYSGVFSSDVDSNTVLRKSNMIRTTPLGKFTNPITGIAIAGNDSMVMLTIGGYTNITGNVYYSNGHAGRLNANTTDATNFSVKNGTGLLFLPVYTGILEMNDNKRAIIGTESGIYSTMDITQASPVLVKETGGNFPNVPVFQIRQQTMPKWLSYNSGIIYVATHGRGIWSTDKFFAPYGIGIEEQQINLSFNSNMRLYPNPATNSTNVWFKAAGDANYKVSVYDVNGRTLIQQTTGKLMEGEQTIQLNTSELNSGIYFISLNGTNNFNANTKLVITR